MTKHAILRRTCLIAVIVVVSGCATPFKKAQKLVQEANSILPCGDLEEAKRKATAANEKYDEIGNPVLHKIEDIEKVKKDVDDLLAEVDKCLDGIRTTNDEMERFTLLDEAKSNLEKAKSAAQDYPGYEECVKGRMDSLDKRIKDTPSPDPRFVEAQKLVAEAKALLPCGDLKEARGRAEAANGKYAGTGDAVLHKIEDVEKVRNEIDGFLNAADKSLTDSKAAVDKERCLPYLTKAEINIEKARSAVQGYRQCVEWKVGERIDDLEKRLDDARSYLDLHNTDPLFAEAQKLAAEAKALLPCGDLARAKEKAEAANRNYAEIGAPVLARIRDIEALRGDIKSFMDKSEASLVSALASAYREDCFSFLEKAETDLKEARSRIIKECEDRWTEETTRLEELEKRLSDARALGAKLSERPRSLSYVLQIDNVTREDMELVRTELSKLPEIEEVVRTQHKDTTAMLEFKSASGLEKLQQLIRKIEAVKLEIVKVDGQRIFAQPRKGIY